MIDAKQISMFDIELPPCKEIETKPTKMPSNENKHSNMAKVPDEEFSREPSMNNIPTVNEIIKTLEKGLCRTNAHEFLSDVFECGAIAISNQFDLSRYKNREERYLSIMKKYEANERQVIVEVFGKLYLLLTHQIDPQIGFFDYLGDLYMKSNTSNSKAGQFFTPYNVSKLCAETSLDGALIEEAIEQDKILTLNEPTCGAGGMVIAAVDVLYNKHHFNYSRNLLVECGDIDTRCVHMSYLQLSLAGIPAIIYHRDALSMETWDRWETPAYIMQFTRFKDVFKGTASDCKEGGIKE